MSPEDAKKIIAKLDSFKESDHPRDTDGKFGQGGGSTKSSSGHNVGMGILKEASGSLVGRSEKVIKSQEDFNHAREAIHNHLTSSGFERVKHASPSGAEGYSTYKKGDREVQVNTRSRPIKANPNKGSLHNNTSEYVIHVNGKAD